MMRHPQGWEEIGNQHSLEIQLQAILCSAIHKPDQAARLYSVHWNIFPSCSYSFAIHSNLNRDFDLQNWVKW